MRVHTVVIARPGALLKTLQDEIVAAGGPRPLALALDVRDLRIAPTPTLLPEGPWRTDVEYRGDYARMLSPPRRRRSRVARPPTKAGRRTRTKNPKG